MFETKVNNPVNLQGEILCVVRALDYGELVFEDDPPGTLAEAMAALAKRLAKWFKEQGIELE
jgi:hypothetical protein